MSAVKNLQLWCRVQCEGYRDVAITNMTTSFRDGMAFCALIHKHRPDLINFDSLRKDNVFENNKLAFQVAEEQLGIPALLDAEDMVALRVPDRLSILTYVSQYYNCFHGRSPIGGMAGIKRPAECPADEPSGKKNQPVSAKVFSPSKPARENSPPPSSNITRPTHSPKQPRISPQDVSVEKPRQTGTLSNKCAVCNGHVHLVQRHLVDGKLYHRNCAKTLPSAPLRDLPTNTSVSRFSPLPSSSKTSTATSTHTPSKLGPSWLSNKTSTPPSVSSSAPSSAPKESPTAFVSKPASSHGSTFTTTTSTATSNPTAAPRVSATAAKTQDSKYKFLQANNEEKMTTSISVDVNKGQSVGGKAQEATAGQTVSLVVNIGGKAAAAGGKASSKQEDTTSNKTKAAAFLSKKIAEENNNNNSKPSWSKVVLKKTDKPQSQVETPKRETEVVKGKVKLKANPALLADLHPPEPTSSTTSPASKSGLTAKTPDRGASKPGSTLPNTSVSENESPADWRSMLKTVSKETKPAGSSQPSTKPLINGAGKTSGLSVGPSSSSTHPSSPSISVTPPASKGISNGPKDQITNGTKSESKISKTKPDYIPRDEIFRELQEIDNQLNELEKRGVELEKRLRKNDEEGEDDSLMDEWFNLIRNKQLAMRRESELVYIGKNQDLEEQQPSVEQELRRLMEKPEHLKTAWDNKREKELMEKLVEIVNDRNAIIDGLDEDRLREDEEDEELNKMMRSLSVKKEKKKKSPMAKLFGWGNKKEE